MVNLVDMDGTGMINFQEFLKRISMKVDADNSEDQIREAFRLFDVVIKSQTTSLYKCITKLYYDGNGFISRKELSHVMTYLGMSLTADEIEVAYILYNGIVQQKTFSYNISVLRQCSLLRYIWPEQSSTVTLVM